MIKKSLLPKKNCDKTDDKYLFIGNEFNFFFLENVLNIEMNFVKNLVFELSKYFKRFILSPFDYAKTSSKSLNLQEKKNKCADF